MIVKSIQKNVVESHDFRSEIATIDQQEMRYVSSLLRNNYSEPILATVREIVANALDANRGSSQPISIQCPNRIDPIFKVRDFGAGLSEADLFGLYTKYGRSTKRSDNACIGGFGIGRFAPLSYTDSFTVISYHGGEALTVMVYVDEHGDTRFSMLNRCKSNEPSGLEINVAVKFDDVNSFQTALNSVLRFQDCNSYVTNLQVNKIEWLIKTDKWAVSSLTENFIVMGGISYPIKIDACIPLDHPMLKDWSYTAGLVLFAPVGSVPLHHSRESLEYTEHCKKYIATRINLFISELAASVQKELDSFSDGLGFMNKLFSVMRHRLTRVLSDHAFYFNKNRKAVRSFSLPDDSYKAYTLNRNKNIRPLKKSSFRVEPIGFGSSDYALLVDEGDKGSLTQKAETILRENKTQSVVVVSKEAATEHFFIDTFSSDKVFYTSKVEAFTKEKKQKAGNVRLLSQKDTHHVDFYNKIGAPDTDFYYIKISVPSTGGRSNKGTAKFGIQSEVEKFEIYKIFSACEAVGLTGVDKIYGVIDDSSLPSNAKNLSDLFLAACEKKMEDINAELSLYAKKRAYLSLCSYRTPLVALADSGKLPKDNIVCKYASNMTLKNDSSDAQLACTRLIEQIGTFWFNPAEKFDFTKEATEAMAQIDAKYPLLNIVINGRYGYADQATIDKVIDYINFIDKNS
jgi:hypothetical protein